MISKFKKNLEPLLSIIALPFLSWNPHFLTFLSLVFAGIFFMGIFLHIYWISIVSIVGFLFDAIDGHVARAQNKVTPFGGFLDSTLDRIADFLFITSFGFAHLVNWELVVVVLFSSVLISYMRSRGELAFGMDQPLTEGLMQRTERIVAIYIALVLFLIFPHAVFGHMSILSSIFLLICTLNIYTVFQRFLFFAMIKE